MVLPSEMANVLLLLIFDFIIYIRKIIEYIELQIFTLLIIKFKFYNQITIPCRFRYKGNIINEFTIYSFTLSSYYFILLNKIYSCPNIELLINIIPNNVKYIASKINCNINNINTEFFLFIKIDHINDTASYFLTNDLITDTIIQYKEIPFDSLYFPDLLKYN